MTLQKIANVPSLQRFLGRKVINPTIENMIPLERGYVVSWALELVVNGETVEWYLVPEHIVFTKAAGTAIVMVERTGEGYEAYLPNRDCWGRPYDEDFAPREKAEPDWIPVTVYAALP